MDRGLWTAPFPFQHFSISAFQLFSPALPSLLESIKREKRDQPYLRRTTRGASSPSTATWTESLSMGNIAHDHDEEATRTVLGKGCMDEHYG